jgi:hypothetical protein
MDDEGRGFNYGIFVGGLIIGIIVASLFFPQKYEGETAEYWFNAYDEQIAYTEDLETQVEEKDTEISVLEDKVNEKDDCLSEIEKKAYYYLSDDFYELRDYIDEVNDMASDCQ